MTWEIVEGDAYRQLQQLSADSVQCVVTSPPYYGLRDYGIEGQLGLETTPEQYVKDMVKVFREVRRVLRDDGTLWLNIGDSYAATRSYQVSDSKHKAHGFGKSNASALPPGCKPKDLIGIPWMLAFALRADGWFLRSEIIWAKPNAMPESVRDRPTNAHEKLFLLTKSERYFYDAEAIKEPLKWPEGPWGGRNPRAGVDIHGGGQGSSEGFRGYTASGTRNKRNVWEVITEPYADAHFATFPTKLVEPCVLAGTASVACTCGAPWERVLERDDKGWDGSSYGERAVDATGGAISGGTARSTLGSSNGKEVGQTRTAGWRPTCSHPFEPDDLELIETPTGERTAEDPTLSTGRRGMNRPRGEGEGRRPITRFEQRAYAELLRSSPHRAEMEQQAGPAFAHYIRTDRSGARPIPEPLLREWTERRWLTPVVPPAPDANSDSRCVVLDPFAGSGTVGVVAEWHGRDFIGIELNPEYAELAEHRIAAEGRLTRKPQKPKEAQAEVLFA